MNQPPRKVPMGKPMSAHTPQQPSGPAASMPPGKQGGGKNVLLILLAVFGGIGALVILLCIGGFVALFGGLFTVTQAVKEEAERQQREIERQGGNIPPPVARPQGFQSVEEATRAIGDRNPHRSREALRYLADQPVDEARRREVVAKTVPLLSDFHRRGEAQRVLKKWATADDSQRLLAVAESAAARRDNRQQQAVMELLIEFDSPEAAPAVAEYHMARGDMSKARRAFGALGAKAVPELLPFFNHPDRSRRTTAREILAQLKVDEKTLARQSLADLKSAQRDRQREAARWLAGHVIIDEELAPQIADALAAAIANRDIRSDAVKALSFWATAETVPALIDAAAAAHAANDRSAERDIVVALTKLNDPRALPAYTAFLQTRYDSNTAKTALAGLGPSATKELLPFVHHADSNTRQIARDLLTEWEVDEKEFVRQASVDLAGNSDNRREAMRYLMAIEQPDAAMKGEVANSLMTLIGDRHYRYDAFRALKKWATADNVPKLLELLDNQDRSIQGEVAAVLVELKDPRAVDRLTQGLGGGDFFKRNAATGHAKRLGPVAEPAVWPHVTNPDWQIAKNAVDILNEIGTKKSLPILEAAKAHQNSLVRSAADRAIAEVKRADRQPPKVAAGTPVEAGPRQMRTWTDATGKNKIEAIFIDFVGGKVRMRTRAGRTLALGLDQLSAEDRKYVLNQVQGGP